MNNKTTLGGIIAGVGLIGKGLYDLSIGDYANAITSILAGLGALGIGYFAKDASNPK